MEYVKKIKDAIFENKTISDSIDTITSLTSKTILNTANTTLRILNTSKEHSQVLLETSKEHINEAEDVLLSYIKKGAVWVRENEMIAYGGTSILCILIIPRTRNLLKRMIISPFISEEGMYKSVEQKLERLKMNLDIQSKEAQKLNSRMNDAIEEYERGKYKLKSTSKQLNALSSKIEKELMLAKGLLRDLKYYAGKPSLQMQSNIAMKVSEFKVKKKEIDMNIHKILKKGI